MPLTQAAGGNGTLGDILARHLLRAGVRHAFGLPGGEIAPVVDALHRAGISFTLTHHESAAAFMAATYGDITGRPGVCVATLGPGATNLATGVAHAYLDRSPVLAVVAQLPIGLRGAHTHQALDLQAFFRPITKAVFQLHPDSASRVIAHAIDAATSERPGPVLLEVPRGLGSERITAPPLPSPEGPVYGRQIGAGRFDPTELRPLVDAVADAVRPVIIAGTGALRAQVRDDLLAFVEALGIPVLVLPKAKGIFPESHPYFGGVLEMAGTGHLFDWVQEADLVLAVGADSAEFDRVWDFPAPVISLDVIPSQDAFFRATWTAVGSIRDALRTIAGGAGGGARARWTKAEVAARRRVLLDYLEAEVDGQPSRGPSGTGPAAGRGLMPGQLIADLRSALPPDTIVTVDTGFHKLAMGQQWRADDPGRYFVSNGLSTMGYAVPAAMTAKLLRPATAVMAVVGDGALLMNLGELETAARQGLGILVVVFVDGSLALIRRGQERRGFESIGVDFGRPDYVAIARAMGWSAMNATDRVELAMALSTCLRASGEGQPALIAAAVRSEGYRE
jgi:acetolactate synthase-1/2/3 large subunit